MLFFQCIVLCCFDNCYCEPDANIMQVFFSIEETVKLLRMLFVHASVLVCACLCVYESKMVWLLIVLIRKCVVLFFIFVVLVGLIHVFRKNEYNHMVSCS